MRDGSGCRRQTNDEIAAESSSKIDVEDEMKDSTTATAPSGLEIANTRCQPPLEMRECTIEGCESRQIHRTPCKQGRRAFSDFFFDFSIFFARLARLANSLQSAVHYRRPAVRLAHRSSMPDSPADCRHPTISHRLLPAADDRHPTLRLNPREALQQEMWPKLSGTFSKRPEAPLQETFNVEEKHSSVL